MLQASSLTKQYNDYTALNNLNLRVGKGEIFCLLGQNGAGKTTTINLFLGFLKPTSGTVSVNGLDVAIHSAETKRFLAYIPEVVMLYGNLSGIDNLDFFSRLAGYRYSKNKLQHFLSIAGLQENAQEKAVRTYSKGMRQKIGIAIALAKNAEAILMDEPTSGLDPKATAEFTRLCLQLCSDGKSILMATHDIFNAVNMGGTIGIMKEGSLVQTLKSSTITANALQDLYIQTI